MEALAGRIGGNERSVVYSPESDRLEQGDGALVIDRHLGKCIGWVPGQVRFGQRRLLLATPSHVCCCPTAMGGMSAAMIYPEDWPRDRYGQVGTAAPPPERLPRWMRVRPRRPRWGPGVAVALAILLAILLGLLLLRASE
jgi:hypothetical protein